MYTFSSSIRSNNAVCLTAGVICGAVYLYWRLHSQADTRLTLFPFLITSVVAALMTFVVWWRSYQLQADVSWWLVIGFSVLFRVIGIGATPILEDDMYRFLWDGRQTIEAGNPYSLAPADHFDLEGISQQWGQILDSINYPDVGTVYGPTAQYGFAFAYLLGPGQIWALQLLLSCADLLLILLLSTMTRSRNVLLYAWSPLVVKEFAFSVHPDVLGALCLLVACFLMSRKYYIAAGSAIALAAGVKVFSVIVAPLILVFNWRAWLSVLATAYIISLPFGFVDAWLPEGLSVMSEDWTFNSPIYLSLLGHVPLQYVKVVMAVVLAFACLVLFIHTVKASNQGVERGFVPRIDIAFALLFICLPALNPWYLVWLLPFAALYPSLWAWVASMTVLLAYVSGINLENSALDLYQQPSWLVWLEFGLVLIAVLLHLFVIGRSKRKADFT